VGLASTKKNSHHEVTKKERDTACFKFLLQAPLRQKVLSALPDLWKAIKPKIGGKSIQSAVKRPHPFAQPDLLFYLNPLRIAGEMIERLPVVDFCFLIVADEI
jgi:hypothetical protein